MIYELLIRNRNKKLHNLTYITKTSVMQLIYNINILNYRLVYWLLGFRLNTEYYIYFPIKCGWGGYVLDV